MNIKPLTTRCRQIVDCRRRQRKNRGNISRAGYADSSFDSITSSPKAKRSRRWKSFCSIPVIESLSRLRRPIVSGKHNREPLLVRNADSMVAGALALAQQTQKRTEMHGARTGWANASCAPESGLGRKADDWPHCEALLSPVRLALQPASNTTRLAETVIIGNDDHSRCSTTVSAMNTNMAVLSQGYSLKRIVT